MNELIACTLSGPDLQQRLAAIAALARRALLSHEQVGATLRLRYALDAADELESLVEQERLCCAFLDFELTRRVGAIQLDIKAPAQATEFLDTLVAHFLGRGAASTSDSAARCGCQR